MSAQHESMTTAALAAYAGWLRALPVGSSGTSLTAEAFATGWNAVQERGERLAQALVNVMANTAYPRPDIAAEVESALIAWREATSG